MTEPAFQPKNIDDYLDLVDQAIYEAGELIACAADEDAFYDNALSGMVPAYEALAVELRALHQAVRDGTHRFTTGRRLPLMDIVDRYPSRIPFADVLSMLNEYHMKGFPGA